MSYETEMKRHRGTGRTTRMLQEAERLAKAGQEVVIVVDHPEAFCAHVLYFETLQLPIRFVRWSPRMDWKTLREVGASRKVVTLVDHYVLEGQFAHVLQAIHRWDRAPETEEAPPVLQGHDA